MLPWGVCPGYLEDPCLGVVILPSELIVAVEGHHIARLPRRWTFGSSQNKKTGMELPTIIRESEITLVLKIE